MTRIDRLYIVTATLLLAHPDRLCVLARMEAIRHPGRHSGVRPSQRGADSSFSSSAWRKSRKERAAARRSQSCCRRLASPPSSFTRPSRSADIWNSQPRKLGDPLGDAAELARARLAYHLEVGSWPPTVTMLWTRYGWAMAQSPSPRRRSSRPPAHGDQRLNVVGLLQQTGAGGQVPVSPISCSEYPEQKSTGGPEIAGAAPGPGRARVARAG